MYALKSAFKSTNFTLQAVLPLVLALGAFVGFPEDVTQQTVVFIEGAIFTIIGLWGPIRQFFKDGVKFRYTGNGLTYLFTFIGGMVPWLGAYNLEGAVAALIEALPSGNFSMILAAGFALINIGYRLFQDKPWLTASNGDDQEDTSGESGPNVPAV